MKRLLILSLALMMALTLNAGANEYVNEAYAVFVEQISLSETENGERTITVDLPNYGQEPIEAVVIDYVMLDDADQPVLGYSADMDGFLKEVRGGSYDSPLLYSEHLAPGTTSQYSVTVGAEYAKATKARAAVSYYRRADGTEFFVAPEAMLWNVSDGTRLDPAPGGKYFPGMTKEEQDLAGSFAMGFVSNARLVHDFMAPAYNMPEGGQWVMEVFEGSLAEQLGLEAGDLIISAAGHRAAEDINAITRAKVAMAQGEAAEFVWMRGAERMHGSISAPAK